MINSARIPRIFSPAKQGHCWTNQESQRVDLEMFLLGAKIFFVHIKIAKFKHEFESHFGLKFTFLVCTLFSSLRFPGFEPKANKNPEM